MVLRINKKRITAPQCVNLFIAGLFLLPPYIFLMDTLSGTFGFSTKITTLIYYGMLWFFLIGAIPRIGKAVGVKEFVGILLFALFAFTLCFLYPDSQGYIVPQPTEIFLFAPSTMLAVAPYMLIGLAADNTQTLSKTLHTGSRIGVVCGALSYVIAAVAGHDIRYDDMSNAYAICVLVCILIADYRTKDIYFLVLGCFSLLLAGTRGPLVCVVVAVLIRVLTVKEEPVKKLLKVAVGILVIFLLLQSNVVPQLLDLISDGFRKIGVTELRIIDYIREGMLLDGSGRDTIADTVRQKIAENPLLGYGPGGDRHILQTNAYVHNLFLEMWVSYGVITGTAILGWMGYWFSKGVFGKDKALQSISTALFCGVVIKLFLSSSYLYSKELFLLLGICMAGSKNRRKNGSPD